MEGSLREMVGALTYLTFDPEWGGDHTPVWADLVGAPSAGEPEAEPALAVQALLPEATKHSSSGMPLAPEPAASSTGVP